MKVDLAILEKYSEGKMTVEEKAEFEKALEHDTGLSDELKKYLVSKSAIVFASDERLKKHLGEFARTLEKEHTQKSRAVSYLLAAAGIALLIGIGWAMNHYFQPRKTHEEIFLSYYQRPDNYEMDYRSSGSDTTLLIWNKALNYYNDHEFRQAISEFEYLSKLPDVAFISRVHFFLGISYLESDKPENAIQAFDQVNEGSSYSHQTQFYKALCLIKLNKQKNAVVLLGAIKNNSDHPYKKEASNILKELK